MRRLLCGVLLIATLAIVPALAQEGDNKLEYGDIVTGEITNQHFEIEYAFNGLAGDVVVIAIRDTAGWNGTLDQPGILLLDTDYNTLETATSYGDHVITMFLELPTDSTYIIIATRRDGRGGSSTGEYELRLLKPPVLQPDDSVQSNLSQDNVDYYVISGDAPFRIEYERSSGSFFPTVSVNVIADVDRLEDVASLGGEKLVGGALAVAPDSAQSYLIAVQAPFGSFETGTVDYSLTRTQ